MLAATTSTTSPSARPTVHSPPLPRRSPSPSRTWWRTAPPSLALLSTTSFTEDAPANAVGSVVATFSTSDPDSDTVTIVLSDTTNYVLGTGADVGKVLLTAAGLALVNAGTDLPAFTLTPNDGSVNGTAVSVDPTVTAVNDAPLLSGASLTVQEGQSVTLSAANFSVSDPDSSSFTYSVSAVSGGIFQLSSAPGSAINSFTSAQLSAGAVQFAHNGEEASPAFSVAVSDGTASSATVVASVSYAPVNEAPTAIALSANSIAENTVIGTGVKIGDLTVTDPDASGNNNVLSLEGTDAASFQIRGSELFFIGASPNFEAKPSYAVTVKSTDGALTFSQPFTVNVSNVNEAPTVAAPLADQSATEDSAFSFTVPAGAFTDVDAGTTLAYTATLANGSALPSWLSFNAATRTVSGTPLNGDVGTVSVTVTASDGSLSASETFAITVANSNDAPTGSLTISGTPSEGQTLTAVSSLTDDDGLGTLAYQWNAGGAAIAGATGITYRLTQTEVGTAITVTAAYTDGRGTAESVTSAATAAVANVDTVAPTFSAGASVSAAVNENLAAGTAVYTSAASDSDFTPPATASSITYSLGGSDAGAFSINPTTGVVSINASPDFETKPSQAFTVVATDAAGNASSQAVALTINDLDEIAPTAPVLALGSGVTGGATAAEATQPSGVVTVTAEAGASVAVTFSRSGGATVTKTVSGAGATAVAVVLAAADLTALGDGSISVSAIASDAAGNVSATSSADPITVDTAAPAAAIFALASDTGSSTTDGITHSGLVNVSGIESGATWAYSTDSGTSWTTGNGSSFTLAAGTHTLSAIRVRQTDLAGNTTTSPIQNAAAIPADDPTPTQNAAAITVDTTVPDAPSISSITDDVSPVTGTVASGGTSNDNVLVLNGTAEANSTVTLFNGVANLGTVTANGSGAWTFTTATLANGTTYSFTATATDAAGNASSASSAYNVTVDTGPPVSLTLTLGSGLSDGATAAEATAATGAVIVVAQAGSNVAVSFSRSQGGSVTKNLIGSGAAQAVVLSTADLATLGDGVINVSAVASAGAGNSSDPSTATFTLDTSAPLAPSLSLQSDTGRSLNDGITSNASVLVGQVESGATWEYSTNAGDTWYGGSGDSFSLAAGSYNPSQVLVRQRDFDGSLSAATANSRTWVIDTTAPQSLSSATAAVIAENSGANQLIYTPQMAATETLTGDLLFYALAEGPDASQFSVDTFTGEVHLLVNPNYEGRSSYSFILRATDLAGLSTDQTVTLAVLDADEVVPLMPIFNSISSDQRINALEATTSVVISGTAEGASTVTVTWGSVVKTAITSGNASGTGTWSTSFSLLDLPADGLSTITATARDSAGNGSATGITSVELDRAFPGQPSLAPIASNNSINAAEKAAGISLSGSAEAGASIAITWNGTTRTTSADANTGAWSLAYSAGQIPADSTNSVITITANDKAGNSSTPISRSVVIDSAAPLSPVINTVAANNIVNAAEKAAGVTLSGTGEAGTNASITWGSYSTTTTVNSSGIWSVVVPSISVPSDNAASSVSVSLTDAAGNISAPGTKAVRIDTAAPDAPVINDIAGDNTVNAAEKAAGFSLSGTTNAQDGSTVAITWGSRTRNTTVSDGAWALNYTAAQIPVDAATSSISAVVTDTAGNASAAGTRTVLIDTAAPALTIASLSFGAGDTGTIKTDFITSTRNQTLNGTLSAALDTGDSVWVQLNGAAWTQAIASGTSFSASNLDLGANDNIGSFAVQVRDAAANPGATRNQTYRLDTTDADVTINTFALSADTGVSNTDLITSSASQTISGTLSANLATGESIWYSLNGGTWTRASATIGRDTWSVSGVTISSANAGVNTIAVRHQDIAGNVDLNKIRTETVTLDRNVPTVTDLALNGGGTDNLYASGDVVTVTATFSESVLVTGTPRIALNIGGVTKYATYDAATSTDTQLNFNYTVVSGDRDANGISLQANALQLNQGTIRDLAGNSAIITTSAIAAQSNTAVDDAVSFSTSFRSSSTSISLEANDSHALLTGSSATTLIGNISNNILTGNQAANSISAGLGRDILTGGGGADQFRINNAIESRLGSQSNSIDWIRDFEVGVDQIIGPSGTTIQQAVLMGAVTQLSNAAIGQLLNTTRFASDVPAAAFTLTGLDGTHTYLAVNNGISGFNAQDDVLLEITGLRGALLSSTEI